MWLVIDIGNTSIKAGLFEGASLTQAFHIAAESTDAEADYREIVRRHVNSVVVERVGIASVAPAITSSVERVLHDETQVQPEHMRIDMPAPVGLRYETPATLGIDRFAAAVAGYQIYGKAASGPPRPVIVVDAGTTITHEVISSEGVYLGGMIAPGPMLLRDVLAGKAAQLPAVPLELPDGPIGRSTTQAMQSGIIWGCIDGIAGALERLTAAIEEDPVIVMTGGWTSLLVPHLPQIDHVDPHLVLKGVQRLMAYKTT